MLMNNIRTVQTGRVVLLFTNFFLIICALYNLKPASRSLYLTALGSANLPYVWIATAVVLGAIITLYHRLVARYSRIHVVLATCIVIIACFWSGITTTISGICTWIICEAADI